MCQLIYQTYTAPPQREYTLDTVCLIVGLTNDGCYISVPRGKSLFGRNTQLPVPKRACDEELSNKP